MDQVTHDEGAISRRVERQLVSFRLAQREITADLSLPADPVRWVVVSRPGGDARSAALLSAWAESSAAHGIATLVLPPATGTLREEAARLQAAARWLQHQGGQASHLVVGGRSLAAALRSELDAIESIVAWAGRPGIVWRRPARACPTLLLLPAGAPRRMALTNRIALWRLGRRAHLLRSMEEAAAAARITAWIQSPLSPRAAAPRLERQIRRRIVEGAAALALVAPVALLGSASTIAPTVVSAHTTRDHDPFADGVTLTSSQIHGDGVASPRIAAIAKAHSPRWRGIGPGDIRGDGIPGRLATGSQALIDGSGFQWFVNTNITFNTTSSASGAASEASFTNSVQATTVNGGNVATTLNDAFDGYNSLCLIVNGIPTNCQIGDPNIIIYNNNGAATLGCTGREIQFAVQTQGTLQITRRVYVPDNDSFARWLNIVTNTGSSPQSVTMSFGNNLGSDSNTTIVTTSGGDAIADVNDTWVTTFQNYSGTTSSDPRLGHILRSSGAPPLAAISFNNGDDNPYWAYTFTLQPGETGIIMDLATGQPSKAEAAAKAAELAAGPAKIYACMTPTEQSQVLNFAGADLGVAVTPSAAQVGVGQALSYMVDVSNSGPVDASSVTVTANLPPGSTYVGASGTGWTCSEAAGVVTCTRAALTIGAAPAITISITAPTSAGSATLSVSVAGASADSTPGNNTATVSTAVDLFKQSLALIAVRGYADLAVTGIQVSPTQGSFTAGEPVQISVTITNQGTDTATPFWVDLYLNPSKTPEVNETWNLLCGIQPCYGIAWGVTQGLEPGQSITLTSTVGSYASEQTSWPGYFASGTSQIVVQADSYNPASTVGAVTESDETNNVATAAVSVAGLNPTGANTVTTIEPRPSSPAR